MLLLRGLLETAVTQDEVIFSQGIQELRKLFERFEQETGRIWLFPIFRINKIFLKVNIFRFRHIRTITLKSPRGNEKLC
jgi:hypothetical protein